MKIYLTLDYELFMGEKTGTVENCLIRPTKKLTEVLDRYGVKATFFVDAAYLYRLNELKAVHSNLYDDFSKISNQLIELREKGHDIQLHIHPQWYNACYNGKSWILEEKYYKLSDLPIEQAKDLFFKSKQLLEGITGRNVIAFRAGGYSIQSFSDVKDLFAKAGVKMDSSVLSHKSATTGPQYFNFEHIPSDTLYKFSDDIVKKDSDGFFYELPITTSRISLLEFIHNYIRYKKIPLSHNTFGDGRPVHIASIRKSRWQRILYIKNEFRAASIDNGGVLFLSVIFKYKRKNDRFVIIGHPKNLSDASLSEFERFVKNKQGKCLFEVVSSVTK